jgi:rfaE bifunctional protein kinase chain/domain
MMIERFCDVDVLVIGDIVLDKYTVGSAKRLSPEAPVPVLNVEEEFYKLGGAANVAANVASLGGSVSLLGMIGSDPYGDIIARECGRAGILLDAIASPLPTTMKNRFLAGRQQLLRVDWEDTDVAQFDGLAVKTNEEAKHLARRKGVIVVSDYGKGVVNRSLVSSLRAAYPSLPIVVDPKPVNSSMYGGATVIKPNEKEAGEMLFALGLGACPAVPDVAARLSSHYKADVVVTRGDKGMVVSTSGKVVELPTAAQEIFDVTGAVGAGMSVLESCKLANIAGGIAVGHVGVVAVTAEELSARSGELLSKQRSGP